MIDTQLNLGYSTNHIRGLDYNFIASCGSGAGSSGSYIPSTYTFIYWAIKAPYSVVRNEQLVLKDSLQAGSVWLPYALGTPDGANPGQYFPGSQLGFTVYAAYNVPSIIAPPTTLYTNTGIVVPNTATVPLSFTFTANDLPQPTNINWNGFIWIVVVLPSSNIITLGEPQNVPLFDTVAYNYAQNI